MDRANAEKIHALISIMFEQANEVLFIVNNTSDADLRKKTQRAMAVVIGELDLEILEPIYKQFPDLRPADMEEVRS